MRRLTPPLTLSTFAFALAACGDGAPPPARESTGGAASSRASPLGVPPPPAAANSLPITSPTLAPSNSTPPPEPPMSAIVGKPAPAFRLKDQTGQERTLAEFKGKRVVLWFFPKANTGG